MLHISKNNTMELNINASFRVDSDKLKTIKANIMEVVIYINLSTFPFFLVKM